MNLQKEKRVKLKGEALKALNDKIFERDDYKCIVCGRFVSSEEKFHHEPCGVNKSDEIEKGAVLCYDCHYKRHFTSLLNIFKKKIEKYLKSLYEN